MLNDTVAITFANNPIHYKYQEEFKTLYKDYFQEIKCYTENDIIYTKFYEDNAKMFQYKKYFGYFLWKPYLILETLKRCSRVLYCDSNLRFTNIDEFSKVYNYQMNKQGAFFVKHVNFLNKEWTKRDCFIMMGADHEEFYNSNQVWTPLMGFDKWSVGVSELLDDYLHYCRKPKIVTELPNVYGENLPEFREHRWEQSVMSILWKRYGFEGIPDTSVMNWVTKHYSTELMKMKEKVNEDPMAKSI